ncbi:MAG TPA: type II toxin-antitoxin system VapC family toxin [Thermomicrobiales bacterium]|nr:type II toxin-antitoxin system VapC family toxin [Thermomicrobiales bacterium]
MRRYLLDAGPLAALLAGRTAAVELMTPWLRQRETATSTLVYGEVLEHIKGFQNYSSRRLALRTLLLRVYPYGLTMQTMEHYADIRRSLRPPYGPGLIGDLDTLIAATAIEHGFTLVTTDSDFQRVPGLQTQIVTLRR